MLSQEDFAHACKLEKHQVEQMLKDYQEAVKLKNAGWHGRDDIQTLVGLEGQFMWIEQNNMLPAVVNFTFAPDQIGRFGNYTLTRPDSNVERGVFDSLENNDWTRYAFIQMRGESNSRTCKIEGMMTDDKWKINMIVFKKMGDQEPSSLPTIVGLRSR